MTNIDLIDARAVGAAVALDVFRNRRLCGAVTLELGLNTNRRLDVVGLNHWGEVFGAEVKVNRSDWLANRGNIVHYIQHCDFFYLATPVGFLQPTEFRDWQATAGDWPKKVGHIEVAADGVCRVVHPCKRLRPTMDARFEIIWRMAARGNDPSFCPRCGQRGSVQQMREPQ